MLSAAARRQPRTISTRTPSLVVIVRSLATESTSEHHSDPPPLPESSQSSSSRRPGLYPRPRPAGYQPPKALSSLPSTFGRNQMLNVSDSRRAILESIVDQFDAPIRYAVAYGSGVFEQDGYDLGDLKGPKAPMLDFLFAVTHPDHFHSINAHQHPSHYPFHARALGSDYISRVQSIGPGVWFNAYVPMNGQTIKYGDTTVDNLCSDLLNWNSLYLAGRMHKPLRIIKDDARVRLTQQVNLTSAVRAALLTLPEEFSEDDLFERIAGISYSGDPRMLLPAENRGKVSAIVKKQSPQFKDLYHRLVVGLPGVHWPASSNIIKQDSSPQTRAAHLKKLPSHLLQGVRNNYSRQADLPSLESDANAYWTRLAGDKSLPKVLTQEMSGIVRYPATIQSLKGIVSAGVGKSIRYSAAKIGKWWKGVGTPGKSQS